MDVRMTLAVGHGANLIVNGVSVIKIFHVAVKKAVNNLLLLVERQLVRKGELNFLVSFPVATLASIRFLPKFQRRILSPRRQMVSGADTAASFLEGGLPVDVLDVALGEGLAQPSVHPLHDLFHRVMNTLYLSVK